MRACQRRIDEMRKTTALMTRRLDVGLVTAGLIFANILIGPASGAAQAVPSGAPLTFGMSIDEASAALGVPLSHVRGRSGDELLLAIPNVKGSALGIRSDGLYLQFRQGRLTGWKGDWGTAKPVGVGW
jgi:hypothetical protein